METVTSAEERRALLERMVSEQPQRLARKMRAVGHVGADAEDLAQETLVRALRSLEGLRGPNDEALVCGWVDRIATNLSRNARRTLARAPQTTPLPEPGTGDDPVSRDEADLIACRRSLQNLLGGLPDDQRAVFIACTLEERATVEVADDLGISQDLVRWRLRTARRRLRDQIDAMSV